MLQQQLASAVRVKADLGEPGVQKEGPSLHNCPGFAFQHLAPVLQWRKGQTRVVHASPTAPAGSIIPDLLPGHLISCVVLLRNFPGPMSPLTGGRKGMLPSLGLVGRLLCFYGLVILQGVSYKWAEGLKIPLDLYRLACGAGLGFTVAVAT